MSKEYMATIAAVLLSMNLNAGPSDHGERHIQQEAHQHGLAEITLAVEGDNIELNLESPAANIVGFEHRASTPAQRRIIDEAKRTLESSKQLFSFIGARCELTESEIDVSAVLGTENDEHEEDAHGHHEQPDHADTDHETHSEETHSEVSANYRFHCEQGSRLAAIALNFFEFFPGIETLKAVWVTDSSQGSADLTAKSNTIYLRGSP
ncbi:MAG: DUF2796 domain-containing protein [Gammaproteobacteria bacterium]|nr:DUF2796 domain-containing protein [Gammaproteobacteria bacterium]